MQIHNVKEAWELESVQDFLIKLGIKPLMHLVEISTFSLNNVILRLTKIMKRADKNWGQLKKISSIFVGVQSNILHRFFFKDSTNFRH